MKEIPLSRGLFALVDDEDFDRVNQFKWSAARRRTGVYAQRHVQGDDGVWRTLLLHNFILGIKGLDHRDGDGLNNRRENLRFATPLQNRRARHQKVAGATSPYRGVSWYPSRKKWVARIKVMGVECFLGYFALEADAARAYDKAARAKFGEFASPNFS